jgi:hypothetical protein
VVSFLEAIAGNLGLLLLGRHVRIHEELSEKEEERKNVNDVGSRDTTREIVTAIDYKVTTLRHHGNELEQLKHSEGRLPPDGKRLSSRLVLRMHADEVVSVHNSVDESVQKNGEVNVSIVVDVGVEPVEEEDGDVVVNVQERKLPPLLSQDNKNCVPKVPNLSNVKQPQEIGKRRIISNVSHTRSDTVAVAVGQQERFDCHVSAEHDLRNVVEKFDRIGVDGRHYLHDLRSNNDEQEVDECDRESTCKIRQKPSL